MYLLSQNDMDRAMTKRALRRRLEKLIEGLADSGIDNRQLAELRALFDELERESAVIKPARYAKDRLQMAYRQQYTRRHPLVEVTYTCEMCGREHTVLLPAGGSQSEGRPHFKPRYCPPEPDEKQSECQRKARLAAVRRYNEKKKAARGNRKR
jgi:hypothetical protein